MFGVVNLVASLNPVIYTESPNYHWVAMFGQKKFNELPYSNVKKFYDDGGNFVDHTKFTHSVMRGFNHLKQPYVLIKVHQSDQPILLLFTLKVDKSWSLDTNLPPDQEDEILSTLMKDLKVDFESIKKIVNGTHSLLKLA